RWLRFGLRGLFVAVTIAALLCATFGVQIGRALRRDRAVAHLTSAGADVYFDYERAPDGGLTSQTMRPPLTWFERLMGLELQTRIFYVELKGKAFTDADVDSLADLPGMEYVELKDTRITDAGVAAIARLPALTSIEIDNGLITDAALQSFGDVGTLEHLDLRN